MYGFERLYALMVHVERVNVIGIAAAVLLVAKAVVAQSHHVLAVNVVARLQRVFPYQQVRQRDGKVVHADGVEQVLLAEVYQAVEPSASLCFASEAHESKSLIEYLVWLGVVVVQGCGRLSWSKRCLLITLARLVGITHGLVRQAEQEVEVALLRSVKLCLRRGDADKQDTRQAVSLHPDNAFRLSLS